MTNSSLLHLHSTVLRGGRLTKWKGIVASIAPMMGQLVSSVSPTALGIALAAGVPAVMTATSAGAVCTPGPNTYTCSGVETTTQGLSGDPLDVTLTPDFTITTSTGDALALFGENGLTVTQEAQGLSITGAARGIFASNLTSGALSITASGAVTGQGSLGIGIYAWNRAGTTELTIDVAQVTGNARGIYARNQGTGALSITASGTVTDTLSKAIYARNYGTNLTIDVAQVTGGYIGIDARNFGTGALSITATGTVTGETSRGIYARNSTGTTDLTIDVAQVTGAREGIFARNQGTGALSITASGTVTGTSDDGIAANNSSAGTDLTLDVAEVTGGSYGISAYNEGSGALSITASGAVNGDADDGIYARNTDGTSLTLDVAAVTGGNYGIFAENNGTGALSITASDTVSGTNSDGIRALNDGTSLTLDVAAVTGGTRGIFADNDGSGALSITASGAVTGEGSDGIFARNNPGTTYLIIDVTGVTGSDDGLDLAQTGSGTFEVTMAGAVQGGTGYGLNNISSSYGGLFTITETGSLGATSGVALRDFASGASGYAGSDLQVHGTLNGDAVMGSGADRIVLNSTATLGTMGHVLGSAPLLDGDADAAFTTGQIDELSFEDWTGSIDGAQMINWEEVDLNGTSTVTFTDTLAPGTGLANLNGIDGLRVAVGADATAQFAQSFRIAGSVTNSGVLDLSTAAPTADTVLTVDNDYFGGGDLYLDVVLGDDASMADRLVVDGDTSGVTNVFVNNLGGTGAQTETGILVIDVGGASNGQFVLADGEVAAGSFVYTLNDVGGDWYLQSETSAAGADYAFLPLAMQGVMGPPSGLTQRLAGRQILTTPQGVNTEDETQVTVSSRGPTRGSIVDGAWLVLRGMHSEMTPASSTTAGLSFEQRNWQLQVGLDATLYEGPSGVWVGGINLFTARGTLESMSPAGGGTVDTEGMGIGLTATWYGNTGFYVDMQLSYGRFESDLASSATGPLASGVDGESRFASLEIGQAVAVSDDLTLTPQAQLSWTQTTFDTFTGAGSTVVSGGDSESLQLRLGLAVDRSFETAGGGQGQFYGIANVMHELRGQTSVLVGATPEQTTAPEWTAELGLGGSISWQDGGRETSLFGELSATRGISDGEVTGLSGAIGMRMTW